MLERLTFRSFPVDCRKCQTATATPAEPGGLSHLARKDVSAGVARGNFLPTAHVYLKWRRPMNVRKAMWMGLSFLAVTLWTVYNYMKA